MSWRQVRLFCVVLACLSTFGCRARQEQSQPEQVSQKPASPWNANNIKWMDLSTGLAEATKTNRKALLVVHTDWCPRCKEYADVFNDADITKLSKDYVMISANQDNEPRLKSTTYAPDGTYVPRTLFLNVDGSVDNSRKGGNGKYQYFVNPGAPSQLAQLMRTR